MSIIRDVTLASRPHWKREEILLFTGPRQAGKTTILRQIEKSLTDEGSICQWLNAEDPAVRELLDKHPDNIFKLIAAPVGRQTIVLIDEIQNLSDPTTALKYLYDEYRNRIKLIVSGSSAFYIDRKFRDSLAGRKHIYHVYPLSFREFLRFKDEEHLIQKPQDQLLVPESRQLSVWYHEYLRYGGYPRVVLAPPEEKEQVLNELAYSYIKKDLFEANIRGEQDFFKLLTLLADQTGNLVNVSELAGTLGASQSTIDRYLHVMQKTFHIALIHPYWKNVRKELTKMPKVYWFDTGLRNFFAGSLEPFATRDDKGQVLENAVFRQLLESKIYDWSDIRFWRTAAGQELDFVLERQRRAYEVKINPAKLNQAHAAVFTDAYPDIKVSVVTIEKKQAAVNNIPVLDIWELV